MSAWSVHAAVSATDRIDAHIEGSGGRAGPGRRGLVSKAAEVS
jgi:hypothetical protein